MAGAVGSTALATSPVRGPRQARPGGHSFKFRARSQPARVGGERDGPLIMLDPKPDRPPAKAVPPTYALQDSASVSRDFDSLGLPRNSAASSNLLTRNPS